MPVLLSEPERRQIERLEDVIESWQAQLRDQLAQGVDELQGGSPFDLAYTERFVRTAQRLSSQLNKELPPDLDPEALAEIRGHLINGLEAQKEIEEARPLDSIDKFAIHAEAVRHIFRDALDGQAKGDED